ncbi:unnamed protein product [Hermetia illucens]|uniref:Uncharacterized protein n=1 Tax=Hermetia illucens TaxID=343691 RepID=A0A7R8V1Q9_HERIL|nr:unnamed protein product [Hermetia illucens]
MTLKETMTAKLGTYLREGKLEGISPSYNEYLAPLWSSVSCNSSNGMQKKRTMSWKMQNLQLCNYTNANSIAGNDDIVPNLVTVYIRNQI